MLISCMQLPLHTYGAGTSSKQQQMGLLTFWLSAGSKKQLELTNNQPTNQSIVCPIAAACCTPEQVLVSQSVLLDCLLDTMQQV